MSSKHFMVQSRDVELAVTYWPNPGKPTLLFLHGFPDCQKTWDHQIADLKDEYALVTFDMRGVGQSTWSGQRNSYHIDHLLADISAVIDGTVGTEGQVHLIGHDWGSVIGWSFICDPYYRSRVLSYTSMSGPHLALMLDWAKRSLFSLRPSQWAAALKQGAFSWYVYLFNIPGAAELLFSTLGPFIWRTALTLNGVEKQDVYLARTPEEIKRMCLHPVRLYRQNPLNPPPLPAVNSITVPVQLIIPKEDRFIAEQLFEHYDEYVCNLQRHVIEGKHWAHHSHKDKFNQLIDAFVAAQ